MENPILDNEDFSHSFSDEEIQFIKNEIIPKFDLENKIIQKISEKVKEKNLTSNDVDEIFRDEKLKYYSKEEIPSKQKDEILQTITQERVAMMGRLSEMRVVNWKIDSEGKSVYSLP